MAERVADASTYVRVRAFLDSEDLSDRRLTAEWLAGRLGIPLRKCAALLDQLAREGIVQRHTRAGDAPWFDVVPPSPRGGVRRVLLGIAVLALCAAVVGAAAMLRHISWLAPAMAIGLIVAFAWLDWEIRSRV